MLFTGETNKLLEKFGQSLATDTYQIICYLTFNTEEWPFPFDLDWPAGLPLFNTCNVWTAKAPRAASVPITPSFSITVEQLMVQAQTFGEVVQ